MVPSPSTPLVFTFPATAQHVRSVMIEGEPWFHHGDVCKILQHSNPSVAARMLDDDESDMLDLRDISAGQTALNSFRAPATGNSEARFVTEPGLYTLVFNSKASGAPAFRRWITHEVIPSIRRTGSYSLALPEESAPAFPVPRSLPEALRAFANEVEAHEETKQRVAELEPAAAAWDKLAAADQDFSVREAAHILNRDPHIETGERRLFAVLRGMGLVDRTDRPYQKHTAHVRLRPRSFTNTATGEETPAKPQVRVTLQGVAYLHKRLGGAVNVHRLVAEEQLALPAPTGAGVVR
jgi:prophage antirepressor-like protein